MRSTTFQRVGFRAFFTLLLLFSRDVQSHGLGEHMLVKHGHKWNDQNIYWTIEQVVRLVERGKKPCVASYNVDVEEWTHAKVKAAGFAKTNCYCVLSFDEYTAHDIKCTPTQQFYCIPEKQWVDAYLLKIGDTILCEDNNVIELKKIKLVKEPLKVYALQVDDTHTFIVGHYNIVTHNMAVPLASLGLAIPFSTISTGGSIGATFGPAGLIGGVAAGAVIGYVIYACTSSNVAHYEVSYCSSVVGTHIGDEAWPIDENISRDRAPGMPTAGDGYFPPKRWDGKRIKNPNGPGVGWPDENGEVWVPSGSNGHGGPHWDVENPKTKRHRNILPGGKER